MLTVCAAHPHKASRPHERHRRKPPLPPGNAGPAHLLPTRGVAFHMLQFPVRDAVRTVRLASSGRKLGRSIPGAPHHGRASEDAAPGG